MATNQELIEQNISLLIGNLQLQLVHARVQIATLESHLGEVLAKHKESQFEVPRVVPNGHDPETPIDVRVDGIE